MNGIAQSRRRSIALAVSVASCLALAASLPSAPRARAEAAAPGAPGDWPTFHRSSTRSGVNPVETQIGVLTAPSLTVDWSYTTGGPIWSSPVISGGVAYVGSDDKKVYALDAATGALEWSFATGDAVRSTPSVAGGNVYVGSNDEKIYALNTATGTKVWEFATGGPILVASPLVAGGKVFVGSTDGNFYALDQRTGAKVWSVRTWSVRGAAAISGGTVYVGSDKSTLWALDASTGAVEWTAVTGGYLRGAPAVVGKVVYVGADDGRVYAYDAATGSLKWESAVLSGCAIVRSAPAVYQGGVFVVTGETCPMTGHLYRLDAATGTQTCSHEMADYATSSVAVANGVALVGSFSHQLYAFDTSDCTKLWDSGFSLMQGGVPSSPAISGGTVSVGSLDDTLYTFHTTEGPPVSSFVSIVDNAFDPSEVIGHDIGTAVQWTNDGSATHDVVDDTGMGLFTSGSIAPGGMWQFTFVAAAIYKYHCTIHPSMTGTIKAPMILTPTIGDESTVFLIEWATAPPPAGFVYDVQIRRPGSSSFVAWRTGVTTTVDTFLADAGPGSYDFKAHVRNVSNGSSADYSAFKTITVT